jgi:hypothetical protein
VLRSSREGIFSAGVGFRSVSTSSARLISLAAVLCGLGVSHMRWMDFVHISVLQAWASHYVAIHRH